MSDKYAPYVENDERLKDWPRVPEYNPKRETRKIVDNKRWLPAWAGGPINAPIPGMRVKR